jgi:hypothetical protein
MAIDWAVQKGANVINLSLGTNTDVASFKQAVEYAAQMGVYVVAASGNEGTSSLLYPAKYMTSGSYNEKMLSVGSFGAALLLSLFCNSGPELEYVAPGEMMMSAYPDLRVAKYTGSSFATPVVAGAVALAQGDASTANKQSVHTYLSSSSVSLGSNMGKRIDTTNLLRTVPGFVARQALFVHNGGSPNTHDATLITRIQGLGYNVTTIEAKKALSSSASGHDLVIISATVSAGDTNTKFRNVTVPVLIWRSDLFDDMALTTSASGQFGSTDKLTRVKVLQSTHPLASGYSSLLNPTVYSAGEWQTWGIVGSGAVNVASLESDSSKSVIFAYDTGSSMISMTAPARRMGFFLRDNQASKLSTSGWQFFESAITWATSGN